jgi:hypothetical protein
MRNAQRWPLVLGLIVLAHGRAVASPAVHRLEAQAGITIHVSNYAGVNPKELKEAERVATSVFRNAGVTARWVDAPQVSEAFYSAGDDRKAHGLSEIQVHIQSSSMAGSLGLSNEVMGLAPGSGSDRQLVYVFYDRVKELAQRQVAAQVRGDMVARAGGCRILGEMIAHEIGHILLNLPSHSETGVMRGDWDLKDLQDVAFGELLFTKQQSEEINTEVMRRAGIARR